MRKLYTNDAQKATLRFIFDHSLLQFSKYFFECIKGQKFIANWHHYWISSILQRVYNGQLQKVIINTPPGSSKTQLTSVLFQAWAFSKNPHCRWILTSYSQGLVQGCSQNIKDILTSKEFQDLYPGYGFKQDDNKKSDWTLEFNGKPSGAFFAASIRGQITGKRAGFLGQDFSGAIVIDDPQKPQDMSSDAKRMKTNQNLYETVRSRKGSVNTPIVLIMQRLHPNDCTGFLLQQAKADNWNVFQIPAIIDWDYYNNMQPAIQKIAAPKLLPYLNQYGRSSYWVQKQSLQELESMEKVDPWTFNAQYKQNPVARGGYMIDTSLFKTYHELPTKFQSIKIFADTAVGIKNHNDFSVFLCVGLHNNNMYILDILRGKWEAPQLILSAKEFCYHVQRRYRDSIFGGIYIEFKQSGQGLIQTLRQETRMPVYDLVPKGDKVMRVNQVLPFIESGRVSVPQSAPWLDQFMFQCSSFSPMMTHKHDDQVDTLVYAIDHYYIKSVKAKAASMYF